MLSSVNFSPFGGVFGIWGDSESDAALAFQMISPLIHACQAARYTSSSGSVEPGGGTYTPQPSIFINNAVNGATINGINGIFPSQVAANAYTACIFAIGTNERTRTRGQTQADITTLAASVPAGLPCLVIGPAAWGWLYPGPNVIAGANDTRLNETNTDLAALFVASHALTLYVDLRTPLWTTQVPPGTTNGLDAHGNDMTVDGTHWAPPGRVGQYAIVSPYVTFV
jgi:hypothetical protein